MTTYSNGHIKGHIKGWCPDAWHPMSSSSGSSSGASSSGSSSGEGLLLRIKPRMAKLSAQNLSALAHIAQEFGSGILRLTSRANIQIPGLSPAHYTASRNRLIAAGLVDDPALERARNILISPFIHEGETGADLYQALCQHLPDFPKTPSKFGYAIDCGTIDYGPGDCGASDGAPARLLSDASADIRFESDRKGGLLVRADGADLGKSVQTIAQAIETAFELVTWFIASGGVTFNDTGDGAGDDTGDEAGRGDAHRSGGRGRMRTRANMLPASFLQTPPAPKLPPPAFSPTHIAPPFGTILAEDLHKLAKIINDVRLTPWRSFITDQPAEFLGWVTTSSDPRASLIACQGAPLCPSAHQQTLSLASQIASQLSFPCDLHISGCMKKCASQAQHAWFLLAHEAGFDLFHHGQFQATLSSSTAIAEWIRTHHAL